MEELLDLYTEDELNRLLKKYSLEYIIEYSKPREVSIGTIKEELYKGNNIYLDSPDGYVRVSEFVEKGQYIEYVFTYDNKKVRVNESHKFQTPLGWEHADSLYKRFLRGNIIKILHESGEYKEVYIEKTNKLIPIVDVQIDHKNHRYYTDGLSSHNTNVGKSAMMCFLAGEFLKQGLNVLYISMEMAEELVMQRVEANLLGISTDDLEKMPREKYLEGIDKVKKKTHGKFFAKEYPTSAAHVGHFRHLIKELKQKKKFNADFIFVDYINICASSRYKNLSGVNSYTYVKAMAEELRGLAVEFDVPIMTATQINRSGFNEGSPDMTSTSESFGLPATLDWFIAVTQDEVLQENKQQLVHLLKTRWGSKAETKPQLVNIDWSRMRYSDVGSTQEVVNKVGNRKPEKKEKKVEDIDWG